MNMDDIKIIARIQKETRDLITNNKNIQLEYRYEI